ncbi:MAG: DNA mismatch repair endonuclease MutL [Bacilli bacterium]|jgi:DNA mismatch repair protein MutL|nr:DNA mismatch repair endonuclease MutL [Bacilli bacterium]
MGKIKVMSADLANMIAAGEVIERPSSVIKELAENSIDADSKHIDIAVYNGGKEMISVKDDGSGMERDDALLAFERHASSKLRSVYDLMRITTLGFRGEAVPSIASVSRVHMVTSSGQGVGTEINAEPGKPLSVSDAALRKGTSFEVKELFYNTPARLKYLKSDRTENASSIETAEHLALGFPSISFSFSLDGKSIFKTTGRDNLLETIASIFGNEIAKSSLEFKLEGDGFEAEGFICHPSINYSTRYNILTFLNNRFVYIPKVQKAIIDGYKDYLPPNRYPLTVIHFTVDYSLVDVNVHPAKKEVRLSCEDQLALSVHDKVQEVLTRTRSTFAQPSIPSPRPTELVAENKTLEPKDFTNPLFQEDEEKSEQTNKPVEPNMESLFSAGEKEAENKSFSVEDSHGFIEDRFQERKPVFFEEKTSFPTIYPVGQVLQTYIVCDSADGLYMIDQHAAAERINFEKCEDNFKTKHDRIVPLFPIVIELTPSLMNNCDEAHAKALEDLGIIVVPFGKSALKVEEIPEFLSQKDDDSVLRDIINQVLADAKVDTAVIEHLAIATKACKMSIKANNILTHDEQVALIKQLSLCRNPLNCPHGRPTVIKLSKYDIEKLFKRTGF